MRTLTLDEVELVAGGAHREGEDGPSLSWGDFAISTGAGTGVGAIVGPILAQSGGWTGAAATALTSQAIVWGTVAGATGYAAYAAGTAIGLDKVGKYIGREVGRSIYGV